MVAEWAFLVCGVVAAVAAWRVVVVADVARAAAALAVAMVAMAPLFVLLAAELVAVVQVLVYLGATVVLFLFAIMLTRGARERAAVPARQGLGTVVAGGLLVPLLMAVRDAFGDAEVHPARVGGTAEVGASMLSGHVIAFEAMSMVLLAALIGAIVLARRD